MVYTLLQENTTEERQLVLKLLALGLAQQLPMPPQARIYLEQLARM